MMISHVGNARVATPKEFREAVADQKGRSRCRLTSPPDDRPVRTIPPERELTCRRDVSIRLLGKSRPAQTCVSPACRAAVHRLTLHASPGRVLARKRLSWTLRTRLRRLAAPGTRLGLSDYR